MLLLHSHAYTARSEPGKTKGIESSIGAITRAFETSDTGVEAREPSNPQSASKQLTSARFVPSLEAALSKANPTSGGVTVSTGMLAAKRHAGVHTPVIACKTIIANYQMAYAA